MIIFSNLNQNNLIYYLEKYKKGKMHIHKTSTPIITKWYDSHN